MTNMTPASFSSSNLMLAHSWNDEQYQPQEYLISEKLDGMRALWDGRKLVSRGGNEIHAPKFFIDKFPPNIALDGELFAGRGQFRKTVSIARRHNGGDLWRALKYVVFDAPSATGGFESRLAQAKSATTHLEYVEIHPHKACRDLVHLREELKRVEKLDGEGLMMRKKMSPYHYGRSKDLLKVKTFKDDEGLVYAHQKGTGKNTGRMGALMCRLRNGVEFKVGSGFSDSERKNPPAIGTVITFRYFELSKSSGKPRFPVFVRIRCDIDKSEFLGGKVVTVSKQSKSYQTQGVDAAESEMKKEAVNLDSTLNNKTICFTGTLSTQTRAKATKTAKEHGARVTTTVSGNTDILVCGIDGGAKATQARSKGVDVWTEDQFNNVIESPKSVKKMKASATAESFRNTLSTQTSVQAIKTVKGNEANVTKKRANTDGNGNVSKKQKSTATPHFVRRFCINGLTEEEMLRMAISESKKTTINSSTIDLTVKSAAITDSTIAPEPPLEEEDVVRFRFRLPDTRVVVRRFRMSDLVDNLYVFVGECCPLRQRKWGGRSLTIGAGYPTKNIKALCGRTIGDSHLLSGGLLYCRYV